MTLRIGLAGLGVMGKNHARALLDVERATFVAAADPDAAARQYVERRTRVPTYASPHEMLSRERLDALIVAVPTALHAEVAVAALAQGLHLLIEKPLASSSSEAHALIAAARAKGVRLAVGHVERFNPAIVELGRRLGRGELGRIFQVQTRRQSPFPPRVRDVGVAVDLATHDIDLMRYLVGSEPERVYAQTARRLHSTREDLMHGVITFAEGTVGTLDVNWLTPTKVRELAVIGERGMFVVHHLTQELSFYSATKRQDDPDWPALAQLVGVVEGDVTRFAITHREPLVLELEDFVAACLDGREPGVTGEDGLRSVEIAEALLASAIEGRPVDLGRVLAR